MDGRREALMRTIRAIFKDDADRAQWAQCFQRFGDLVKMYLVQDIPDTMAHFHEQCIKPALFIISTRLYPVENPGLIKGIRGLCPNSEFLLIASPLDPLPPLDPLVNDNVRHLVIDMEEAATGGSNDSSLLYTVVNRLLEMAPLKIKDYLKPGTYIHEFNVSSTEQKEELIGCLEQLIGGEGADVELLRQKGALLADEMLENAFYGAPRDEKGASRYEKGAQRLVQPHETINFRFGFDGACLAMEMEDNWGSLAPNTVLEYLAINQNSRDICDEMGGRGLFIIWRFLDHMHIHIEPGRQTVVGGQVKLIMEENLSENKGFHITCSAI
jgi:hypothetical protein